MEEAYLIGEFLTNRWDRHGSRGCGNSFYEPCFSLISVLLFTAWL